MDGITLALTLIMAWVLLLSAGGLFLPHFVPTAQVSSTTYTIPRLSTGSLTQVFLYQKSHTVQVPLKPALSQHITHARVSLQADDVGVRANLAGSYTKSAASVPITLQTAAWPWCAQTVYRPVYGVLNCERVCALGNQSFAAVSSLDRRAVWIDGSTYNFGLVSNISHLQGSVYPHVFFVTSENGTVRSCVRTDKTWAEQQVITETIITSICGTSIVFVKSDQIVAATLRSDGHWDVLYSVTPAYTPNKITVDALGNTFYGSAETDELRRIRQASPEDTKVEGITGVRFLANDPTGFAVGCAAVTTSGYWYTVSPTDAESGLSPHNEQPFQHIDQVACRIGERRLLLRSTLGYWRVADSVSGSYIHSTPTHLAFTGEAFAVSGDTSRGTIWLSEVDTEGIAYTRELPVFVPHISVQAYTGK